MSLILCSKHSLQSIVRNPILKKICNLSSFASVSASSKRSNLYFTSYYEWIQVSDDGNYGTVGMTDAGQHFMHSISSGGIPEISEAFVMGDVFGVLESFHAFTELYMPVSGEIVQVNPLLGDWKNQKQMSLINNSAESDGWLIKIRIENPSELQYLLSKEEYDDILQLKSKESS